MKQRRKTSPEEHLEIINYTIAHDKNYQAAIEKYHISYQQVYSWVRKFEKDGSQNLLDCRSKGLESKPNLTPESVHFEGISLFHTTSWIDFVYISGWQMY